MKKDKVKISGVQELSTEEIIKNKGGEIGVIAGVTLSGPAAPVVGGVAIGVITIGKIFKWW